MSEHILNMLPINEEEKKEFVSLLPDAVWEYPRRSTVTPEQLAAATIILGPPDPRDLVHVRNLRWLQSLWMGVDDYMAPGILPETGFASIVQNIQKFVLKNVKNAEFSA